MTLVTALCQFPSELNHVIFSYVDLQQLLECLAVCRQWRDNIPVWVDTQEKSLFLSIKQLNNAPPSLQCIASVVREIQLAPLGEQGNFQQLIDKLAALDLPLLNTLLVVSTTVGRTSVIAVSESWYQLGTKLSRLWLNLRDPARVQVDLSPLLVCCPFLTHVSLVFAGGHQSSVEYLGQHQHEYLQYLNIDAHIQLQDLLPLVRHCPQLHYLRFKWNYSMDMEDILDACPSLKGISIHNTMTVHHSRDPWWKERSMLMSPTTLQELDIRVMFGDQYRQIATIIARHSAHLKRIHLLIDGGDWGAHMKQHDFNTLVYDPLLALKEFKYLANRRAPVEASFVIPLLKKCPSLQRLSLDARNADPIYRALVGLDLLHLQYLSVCNTDWQMNGLEDLLFSIANTNAPLEHFVFSGDVFQSHVIYQALAQISSLRHIELKDFARIRDKKCMTRCLSRLRGDGSCTRNLESIMFFNVEGFMTVEAFGSLRKILSLKRVTFHRCGYVSERGLRLLIDRQPPLDFLKIHLSSRTMDHKPLEPILAYARTKIHHVESPGP